MKVSFHPKALWDAIVSIKSLVLFFHIIQHLHFIHKGSFLISFPLVSLFQLTWPYPRANFSYSASFTKPLKANSTHYFTNVKWWIQWNKTSKKFPTFKRLHDKLNFQLLCCNDHLYLVLQDFQRSYFRLLYY